MAEQNVDAEGRRRQMVLFLIMVDTIRNDRIRLTELLGGHEEFQQLLDYVVDIAVEVNRIGQLPASNVGREMVNNYFHYLREVVDNIIDLLG